MDKQQEWEHLNADCAAELDAYFAPEKKNFVLGDGDVRARILLVGEAPGAQEARLGRPFVGKAGKNLDEFLEKTGLDRKDVYITNTVKFRPVKVSASGRESNRTPGREEIRLFLPWLRREIEWMAPQIVVTLGNVPLQALLGRGETVGKCHGRLLKNPDSPFPVFSLYHPASVIYNPSLREVYLQDLAALKALLEFPTD